MRKPIFHKSFIFQFVFLLIISTAISVGFCQELDRVETDSVVIDSLATLKFKNGEYRQLADYYEDGSLKRIRYWYGPKNLKFVKNYKNGVYDGQVIRYNLNGQMSQYKEYKAGKPTGVWRYYYGNGCVMLEIRYRNDSTVEYTENFRDTDKIAFYGLYVNKKRDSVWTYWNESGEIYKTEVWKMGRLIETRNR